MYYIKYTITTGLSVLIKEEQFTSLEGRNARLRRIMAIGCEDISFGRKGI